MPTKSIFKDIIINSETEAIQLADALEAAKATVSKEVVFSRAVYEPTADEIKELFSK
jgi:hypothetical protein